MKSAGIQASVSARTPRSSAARTNRLCRAAFTARAPAASSAALGLARAVLAEQRHAAAGGVAQQPGLAVDAQLVARVGDVEVAHRELPDAVARREEHFLALLHREALGLVGEVRA